VEIRTPHLTYLLMPVSRSSKISQQSRFDERVSSCRCCRQRRCAEILSNAGRSTTDVFEELDQCITTIPGIEERHISILHNEGIMELAVLSDMFDHIEWFKYGTYVIFTTWLINIGIDGDIDSIANYMGMIHDALMANGNILINF